MCVHTKQLSYLPAFYERSYDMTFEPFHSLSNNESHTEVFNFGGVLLDYLATVEL